jgi:predicted transcriptional regulator
MRKNTHTSPADAHLTRRERQIMDVVYAGGEVSAREIWQKLPDQRTYSTVRTLLGVLESKGISRGGWKGRRFSTRQNGHGRRSRLRLYDDC